ncbi:hypothetical protein UM654_06150 [Staphylococcus aureus]|nr:hypothetical protein UM654_06150 [Staphylococcus aureus]
MTILSKLSKGIAVTAVATGISLSPIASSNISHAATEATSTTQNNSAAGQMSKVGEHDAQFNLNKNITYDVDENGIATLTDKNNGKTEQLPYSAKDKDGKDVTLVYYEENDKLFVHAQEKSSERGWKKCAAGIAGGATTGATTVGLSWSKCRYFNTAASHELMLPLGHCPNRHFLKYAALILIFHSIAQ